MNVELVTRLHCAAGITTHDAYGSVTPKFWAQSSIRRVIAEPASEQGMAIDTTRGVMMLGFLVDIAGGRWFGRTAEAWIKTVRDGDQLHVGGLAALADTDPEVRTAIIAQGVDMLTGQACTMTATFDLNEDGSPVWHESGHPDLGGSFDVVADAVRLFVRSDRPKHSVADMKQFIAGCGWRVQIIDG